MVFVAPIQCHLFISCPTKDSWHLFFSSPPYISGSGGLVNIIFYLWGYGSTYSFYCSCI